MLISILIAIGLSMDSFAVAFACGTPSKKNRFSNAALLLLSFCFFQTAFAAIGWFAGFAFLSAIEAFGYWAAFILLSCVGGKIAYDSIFGKRKKFEALSIPRVLVLSLATSMDALVVGVGFAFTGSDPTFYLAAIAFFTAALTFIGAYFGSRLRKILGGKAELFGGIVLIAIGVKTLLEHMHWLAGLF